MTVSPKPPRGQPKPSREEKKAATREALIEAATRVFARQGYVAASVDDVAWEAGVTKGAVYSNFASKDELFAAVIERHQDQRMLAIAARADPTAPVAEQTALAGQEFMAVLDPEFGMLTLEYTLYAARHPEGHEAMREHNRRMRTKVAEEIERLAAQSDAFPILFPVEELVVAFFAIGDGIALQRLSEPEAVPDDLYGRMLEAFVRGMEALGQDRASAATASPKRTSSRARTATQ